MHSRLRWSNAVITNDQNNLTCAVHFVLARFQKWEKLLVATPVGESMCNSIDTNITITLPFVFICVKMRAFLRRQNLCHIPGLDFGLHAPLSARFKQKPCMIIVPIKTLIRILKLKLPWQAWAIKMLSGSPSFSAELWHAGSSLQRTNTLTQPSPSL